MKRGFRFIVAPLVLLMCLAVPGAISQAQVAPPVAPGTPTTTPGTTQKGQPQGTTPPTFPPDTKAPTPDSSTTPADQNESAQPTSSEGPDDRPADRPAKNAPETSPETQTPDKDKGEQPTPPEQPKSPDQSSLSEKPLETPHTEMLSHEDAKPDTLLELPALPKAEMSLLGGTARKIDKVRNRILLDPFGGGKQMNVYFDERSHIYRDGRETTVLGIRPNDRVYVDTMEVNSKVFAKNVRVITGGQSAEASGSIVEIDYERSRVQMRDRLSGQTVSFFITPQTRIVRNNQTASISDLQAGALVDVNLFPGKRGRNARMVQLLAVPGGNFVFLGRVTHVDLRAGILALDNKADGKNYELRFDPARLDGRGELVVGSEVVANTRYDGTGYKINSIQVTSPVAASQQ